MPYVNDDATLANVIGPAYVAQQAGLQNDTANATAQNQLAIDQATAPAKIQAAGLENLFKQAQTGQTEALTQGTNLANQKTAALMPSDVQAGIAGNQLKVQGDQAGKIQQLGQLAGTVAGYMDQIPQAARPAAMQQLLAANGVDPSTLGVLAQGDPDQLRAFSQKAIQASSTYQQEYMKQNMESDRAQNVATIGSNARVQSADISAQARQYAADVAAKARQAMAGMGQLQQQLYTKVANGTATPQERAALDSINQVQQLTRAGSPFQSAITGTQVPSNVPPVPDTTQTPPNNPDMGHGPLSGPAAEQAAKVAFGNYEPDKYDYGINPATGNFARRPKGK